MKKPLISIIIPIYKVEKYLDQCVASIVNQTYKNLEIILVDDGSPDKCPQKCDEWALRDNRIKVIHKENGGLSSARNAGIKSASGDYIGFIDSDDWADESMYEKLINGFKSNLNVGITACMIYSWTDGVIKPYNVKWTITKPRIISDVDYALMMIGQQTNYTACNKLYKAELIKQVEFRKGRNNEDTLYMYDISKVLRQIHLNLLELPYFLYYYRQRADSITTSTKNPLEIDVIANYKDLMSECRNEDIKLYNTLYYKYVEVLYHFLENILLDTRLYNIYYKKYQLDLRVIPLSYIKHNFVMRDVVFIYLLRNLPKLRKIIKIITREIKN